MTNDFPTSFEEAVAMRDEIYVAISILRDGLEDLSDRIDRVRRIKAAWNSEDEPLVIQ